MIEIMVSDTGVGIPIDCFEKVFEPLVKSHIESIEGGAGVPWKFRIKLTFWHFHIQLYSLYLRVLIQYGNTGIEL